MDNDPVLEAIGELAKSVHDDLELAPGMVIKAVIVAEVMFGDDGDRHLLIMRDHDIKDWEIRGMFDDVASDLTAHSVVDWMEELED